MVAPSRLMIPLLVLCNAALSPPSALAQLPQPRAYYPFEGSLRDWSGNGYDGVLQGNTTSPFVAGRCGEAFTTNMGTSWVSVAHDELDLGTGDFSVAFFVAFATDNQEPVLLEKCDGQCGSIGWTIASFDTGNGKWGLHVNGACAPRFTCDFTFGIDVFHHIAWTRQGDLFTFYIDGEVCDSWSDSCTENGDGNLSSPGDPLLFGRRTREDGRERFNLVGMLDEIRLYDVALTQAQVKEVIAACDLCSARTGNVDTGDGTLPFDVLRIDGSAGDACREVDAIAGVPVMLSVDTAPSMSGTGSGHFGTWIYDGPLFLADATQIRIRAKGTGAVFDLGLGARCLPVNNTVEPGSCPCPATFPIGRTSRALGSATAAGLCLNRRPGFPKSPTSFSESFPRGDYVLGGLIQDRNAPASPLRNIAISNWVILHVR